MLAFLFFSVLALCGTLLMTGLSIRALSHFRRPDPFGASPPEEAGGSLPDGSSPYRPEVSILKPLCGLDDGLEENLRSFARLQGARYEVIGSVERPDDPAAEVFRRVAEQHPGARFQLVVGGGGSGLNPKIARLIAASRMASGDILFVSDSNVRCAPEALGETLSPIRRGEAEAVSNPFAGHGARDTGSIVEALHLLGFVIPGNLLAQASGRPCLVGKSFALKREALERIGGFVRFRDILAEDQAIALALAQTGARVVYSPVVVANIIERRSIARALARQIRWGKIRISFSVWLYAGEFLMNPLPPAILACVCGILAGLPAAVGLFVPLLVAGSRIGQAILLDAATGGRLPARGFWVVPFADLLQFGAQFVPFFSRSVDWNGHRARLGPGTIMIPLEPMAS
ncbi:MAG: hypothetical protein DIJKHBIC_00644 [Thermoanaerobaculia bacterium]|nr:hypothetical protein [Thermoanaerobaculia bacterium]